VEIPKKDAWSYQSRRCSRLWDILLIFLVVMQAYGVAALIMYCIQTITCAEKVKYPHYHCENAGTRIPYEAAMNVELVFVVTEFLSRIIFLAFCWNSKREKKRELNLLAICKVPKFWGIAWYYILCIFRFGAILSDRADLGLEKDIAMATIVMYMVDGLCILLVVVALNDVKIQDLSNTTGPRTKKIGFYVFKVVLGCFWLQFFIYMLTTFVQGAFDVVEFKSDRMDFYKAVNLAKIYGQFEYLKQISACLLAKLLDDDKHIIGERKVQKEKRRRGKILAVNSV